MAEVRDIVTRCLLGLVAILTAHRSVKVYGVDSCSDPNVAYIASNIVLKYEVIANLGLTVSCRVNLTNVGSGNVTTGNWEIYFSHTRLINSTSLSNSTGLRVDHVNGVLQKFVPLSNFGPLMPNSALVVTFLASDWIVSRTDVMPNWYVVTRGCQDAQVISSTAGESLNFVSPFISSQQWKRTIPVDTYNPWTPDDRYAENYVKDLKGANSIVIPTPFSTNLHSTEKIDLRSGQWVVIIPDDASLQAEAKYISEYLHIDLIPASPNVTTKYSIGLNINPAAILTTLPLKNNEANYRLVVSGQTSPSITISGQGRAGVFYGIQTLVSLSDSGDGKIPAGSMDDGPRFDYRGMHIDVCRNFHTTDDLMRLLDAMATYKLNNLHLHLGDDEGWRLEIPEIPELIEIGSKRCHDVTGDQCIMPQLGSAPTLPNLGSGFYSVGEYRSILDYANKRHIRIIPEFDMPGHAHAAVNAMLARYRKYNSSGDSSRANEYLLTDLNDNSDYTSIQGFTDNAINPCVNSTYDFIETVLRSMQNLHADIQPLTLYHIGGDEVSSTAWINSSACRNQFGPNLTQIVVKSYFVQRVSNITRAANVAQVIWEDGIYSGNSPFTFDINVNNDTYCNTWDNVWGWGTEGRAYTLANAGYKVILSHATHLYFDFPSEPDPEERGYYWATRTTSMKKAFSYLPDDFYGNMDLDVDRMGSPLNRTAICITYGCQTLTRPENIVGMQGHMWSETIRTSSEVDYMIFPRLLALAERAWHKAAWESEGNLAAKKSKLDADWEQFANAVGYNELKRLDRMGVKYRLAPPGVRVDNSTGKVYVTSGLPGSDSVYYRKTSGDEWTVVPDGNQLTLDSSVREVQFSVWSSDRRRSSRSVVVPLDIYSNDNAAPSTSVSIFILLFPWILINSMF